MFIRTSIKSKAIEKIFYSYFFYHNLFHHLITLFYTWKCDLACKGNWTFMYSTTHVNSHLRQNGISRKYINWFSSGSENACEPKNFRTEKLAEKNRAESAWTLNWEPWYFVFTRLFYCGSKKCSKPKRWKMSHCLFKQAVIRVRNISKCNNH